MNIEFLLIRISDSVLISEYLFKNSHLSLFLFIIIFNNTGLNLFSKKDEKLNLVLNEVDKY